MDIAQAATKDIAITIAAAQSTSVPLDVAANVQEHLRFVEAAADAGHALLAPLRDAARRNGRAITVGAPVDSGTALPTIGAICADTNFPSHAASAAQAGANVYAAGVLTFSNGYAAEAPLWESYARDHRMVVLIANHGGPSGGYVSAGNSGVWDTGGKPIANAKGNGHWLVLATPS